MKVSEIVSICKQIISTADVTVDISETTEEMDEADITQTDLELVTCCNFVLQELYCDYSMAIRRTTAEVKDGFCDVSQLNLGKVISLRDGEGRHTPFRYAENKLYVEGDGTYNLVYSAMPETVTYFGEITLPGPVVCQRTLVYGMLREYFTRLGDYVSANVWQEKYQNALRAANVKTSGQYLPRRRWL